MIALVVTIIVLLILAAVAINLTIGDNGIITRAMDSKEKYEDSRKQEEIQFELAENEIDAIVEEIIPPKVNDENPGDMEGDGTQESPYIINSIEDFMGLSKSVNEGETYSEKIIILGNSLDFESDNSYMDINNTTFGDINEDGNIQGIKEEVNSGKGFMPIGNVTALQSGSDDFGIDAEIIGNPFSGVFYGNDKYIRNIYLNNNDVNGIGLGLFGWNSGVIANLTTSGKITDTNNAVSGGIAAWSNGKIINCNNYVEINSNGIAGGITGSETGELIIYNCKNKGKIIGNDVGGIIGKAMSDDYFPEKTITIEECSNEAAI